MKEQYAMMIQSLDGACKSLTDAESQIWFVCRAVVKGNMTPEMALLRLQTETLPEIGAARKNAERVRDEIRCALQREADRGEGE